MRLVALLICLFMISLPSHAQQEFALQAPSNIGGGSAVKIGISPTPTVNHFVTIVRADTPAGKYGRYAYATNKASVSLIAPVEAGDYEIRLLSHESGYPTLVSQALTVTEVQASVSGPASADIGDVVSISWEGPGAQGDFITVVPVDTPEGEYGPYSYAKSNPVELRLPESTGAHEIRYMGGQSDQTLARAPITINDVSVSLEAPTQVDAGSSFDIAWSGSSNARNFITVVPIDKPEGQYDRYVYARQSPVSFDAPDRAGEYEIRYLSAGEYRTLARAPLAVGGVEASVEASEQAVAGATLSVSWTGPDNRGDYLTIVAAGTPDGEYGRYTYTSQGSPLELPAPTEPGDYQIRYQTGGEDVVLASQPITLTDPSGGVQAPSEIEAGQPFDVSWTGDGNQRDYIAITDVGQPDKYHRYRYTSWGNPVTLRAPQEPGEYEVHYLNADDTSLASQAVKVVPSRTPGELLVLAAEGDATAKAVKSDTAVEVILDASGSMLQRLDGERRIDIAKQAITDLIDDSLPAGLPFAFRAFGHVAADSCDTELMLPMAPLDASQARQAVSGMSAKNLAKTPIADSLAQVPEDLAGIEGEALVILLTDGEETCDGDPRAAIAGLQEQGYGVRVNIIGFAIDDAALKQEFAAWAEAGRGAYFDAQNADELNGSIRAALRQPYSVRNAEDQEVASGFVGGEPVSLLPGGYTLHIGEDVQNFEITAEQRTTIKR